MYNRITFAKLVPGRGPELGEFFEREIASQQRKVRGNWRELLLEDDEYLGEVRYFSVWHEKTYADAYEADGGFERTAALMRPFFSEDPVVHNFDTHGYYRPLPDEPPGVGVSRLLTADDLLRLRVPSDAQISPDGGRVAFVVTTVDREADAYCSGVWVADTRADACTAWTADRARASSPRWSPDGRWLAFLSNRGGSPQVWLLSLAGGEATVASDIPGDVVEIAWAPDSQRLALVVNAPAAPAESDVRVIDRLRYKLDGAGMTYDRVRHVWLLDLSSSNAHQITDGPWDDSAPAWSPDGTRITFLSNRTPDPDRSNAVDVFVVAARPAAEPVCLTTSSGPCFAPAWSPDGRWIAYTGNTDPPETGVSTNHHLWLVAADGSAPPRDLMPTEDVCLGSLPLTDLQKPTPWSPVLWSPDGGRVYVIASREGSALVYEVVLATGRLSPLMIGERHVLNASLARDGQTLAFTASTAVVPGEVFVARAPDWVEQQISDLNDALLADVSLSAPERMQTGGMDGTLVEGWLYRPPAAAPRTRSPAILEVHGGPYYVLWGHTFFFEVQLLAARGYVVLCPNPRGSQGYGQAFASANRGDWGGVDYHDLMTATDWLAEQPFVDAARLGVTGGSFGGFMTNWIVTQTQQFRAAVSTRGISNHQSAYGTSDVAFGPMDWIFYGPPWEQPDLYRERSPITHVRNVRTPILIIHNERDLRCAMEQAEQWYTALRYLDREVKLVRIPDEDHNLFRSGRPSHRLARLGWIVRWFDEHLQAAAPPSSQPRVLAEAGGG